MPSNCFARPVFSSFAGDVKSPAGKSVCPSDRRPALPSSPMCEAQMLFSAGGFTPPEPIGTPNQVNYLLWRFLPKNWKSASGCCSRIADSRGTVRRDERFNSLIAKVYREGRRHDGRRAERLRQQTEDRALQATTAMVQIQRDAVPASAALPPPASAIVRTLNQPECCYICKEDYTEVHFFYHLLCPKCAAFNYEMRHLSADLTGRTALVTGGRVKIGFQTVLRLLRDGAKVIVTTRFPLAAARRFHAEADSRGMGGSPAPVRPGFTQYPGGRVVRPASAGHRAFPGHPHPQRRPDHPPPARVLPGAGRAGAESAGGACPRTFAA